MLTITLETTSTESEGAAEVGAAAPSGGPGGAGQSLNGRMLNPDDIVELGELVAVAGASLPTQASWARYVTGVDQAIERVRSEADARLLQEQQPPKAEQPGTSFLEDDDASGQKSPAAFVKEAAIEASHRIKAESSLMTAIDLALGGWKQHQLPMLRLLVPTATGAGAVSSSTLEQEVVPPADRATVPTRLDNDRSEPVETDGSELAVAGLIYLTAASSREILVRRSHREPAPETRSRWQCLIRERGNPVNRRLIRWSKRPG
jgi:hypothetical protein